MAEKWERDLADRIWSAKTSGDVEFILKEAEERYDLQRVPVGRDNNIGTIRMGSDPGLALVERVTNGMDSLLEMKALLDDLATPGALAGPQEAAQRLFGVPTGGLGEMTDTERRTLAENLEVALLESEVKKRPTVRVDDRGMGQHPDDFDGTLLSLNESNKVGKPYTMGTYGQGGSVTFGFCEHTIIVSRRHPALLNARPDVVGWTVVNEEEGDPALNMLPWYVWLVKSDGEPLTLPADSFPELDHGTRITHVEYDIQRLRGPFQTQAWQFFHATLFDPVLPFLLSGNRTPAERKAKNRVVIGNAARLSNTEKARGKVELAVHDSHRLDLGPKYGSVLVSYWALRNTGANKVKEAAGSYVQADNAVSLTLHGQRQDAQGRVWIKNRAHLPYLFKSMVVHINGNELLPPGRRELFASTRERATDSDLREAIYEHVAELLRGDEELKRLNHEEKEELLKRSTVAANDKIRKRLGKFVKTKLQGTTKPDTSGKTTGQGSGSSRGIGDDQGHGNPPGGGKTKSRKRNTDDSSLHHVPTQIAFERKSVRISQGFSAHLWVDVDAKNGYLPDHDDAMTIRIEGAQEGQPSPLVLSRSKLLGGRTRWGLHAPEDVPLGDYKLAVHLDTANGPLEADIPIEVIKPPIPKKSSPNGSDEDTGPEVNWVTKDEWEGHDMNSQTVGKVDVDDESTIIWVNRHYSELARHLGSRRFSPDQVQNRADRYLYPVACGLWLQDHELRQAGEDAPEERYQIKEMHRLAEAVLVAMTPDIDAAGVEGGD